jgi:hypothetical protein
MRRVRRRRSGRGEEEKVGREWAAARHFEGKRTLKGGAVTYRRFGMASARDGFAG